MSDASVIQREREVEHSRAKLSQDLAALCSPETLASFTDDLKDEALGRKDALWENIKARAASNPAAMLAIAAGIGWRLFQHPPIASALIGAGLFSLWNTQPRTAYDATGRRLGYIEQSKVVAKEQVSEAYSDAADLARQASQAAKQKGAETWQAAREKMEGWQDAVESEVGAYASQAKTASADFMDTMRVSQHDLRDNIARAGTVVADKFRDDDTRNTLLLGAAGIAIAAALGIACQRKIAENNP